MERRILIIDDHDDLASELSKVFGESGHHVEIAQNRTDALNIANIETFDLVVTDLDNGILPGETGSNGNAPPCLPVGSAVDENVKAFKLCAANFRREDFDENELKTFVETILNYKAKFVDKIEVVKTIHEKIEFELPSAISTMNSVLDYLINRVEKIGVINAEQSNLFIALDEAFVNAVKHGNKFDALKLIKVTADVSTKEARFTIEDEGEGFKLSEIPDPTNPENLFKTSGRGVMFIHNIMDEVTYNERGNRLEMVKKNDTISSRDPI